MSTTTHTTTAVSPALEVPGPVTARAVARRARTIDRDS